MSHERTLFITFRPGADRDRTCSAVRAMAPDEVLAVHPVAPETGDPVLDRLAYAYVSADADLGALSRRIASLDAVESVDAPARRRHPRGGDR